MKSCKCPSCKEDISIEAKFCKHCGSGLKCPNCNENIIPDSKFCKNCGGQLTKNDNKQQAKAVNKIKYDGNSFEAEFTDIVGKDVTNTYRRYIQTWSTS